MEQSVGSLPWMPRCDIFWKSGSGVKGSFATTRPSKLKRGNEERGHVRILTEVWCVSCVVLRRYGCIALVCGTRSLAGIMSGVDEASPPAARQSLNEE
jgi:hypothetical protein